MIDICADKSDYEEGKHRINAKRLMVYVPGTGCRNKWLSQTLVSIHKRQQEAIDDLAPKYIR